MTSLQKIEEWMKAAEENPESALLILKLMAGRLRDLSERDEELLAENIALQDGSQVKEYRQRIAHLEYQLDLLRRRFGPDGLILAEAAEKPTVPERAALLAYQGQGRIIRLEAVRPDGSSQSSPGRITGELSSGNTWPRLLVVPEQEELVLLFSSGRVSTCPVLQIPALETGGAWTWEQAALPDEPHGGESLASLMPLTRLPLSDFCLQVSRRGCVKKTMVSLAQTILENHFIGRGTLQKADQPFEAMLCRKEARIVLVTYEGRLLCLDVDNLTYSTEEMLRLGPHDHVVAAFEIKSNESLLCLTQTGKAIHREASFLQPVKSAATRGQALISPERLEQGTRFIGAAAIRGKEDLVVLEAGGQLTRQACRDLTGSGALPKPGLILAFGVVPTAEGVSQP